MTATLLVLAVVLYVLAVARITRLINADEITDPVRVAIGRRYGFESRWFYLVSCAWCVSFWIGLATAPLLTHALGLPIWWAPLLALAASQLTGLGSQLDNTDLDIEVEDV
jgi:hypothetical protein